MVLTETVGYKKSVAFLYERLGEDMVDGSLQQRCRGEVGGGDGDRKDGRNDLESWSHLSSNEFKLAANKTYGHRRPRME